MIKRICDAFLTGAANRWPEDMRAEMLAEWRAELHAAPGGWHRLRYAASLAVARPHGEQAVAGSTIVLSFIGSLVVIVGLPVAYLQVAGQWTEAYYAGSIPWQVWVAVASVVAAVPLAIICARITTGVTQLIGPTVVPVWTFGVALLSWFIGVTSAHGLPVHAEVIDMSLWALTAAVLGTAAVRVALARHTALSWAVVGVAVLVSYWFGNMHSTTMSRFDANGMENFFGGDWLSGFSFFIASRPSFHVTIFLLVYTHYLVLRARPVMRPIAMPAHR
jgi:hypothetical protein